MKRCYQCGGPFGLVRYRVAFRQLCSKRCVAKHKAEMPTASSDAKNKVKIPSQGR